MARKQKLKTIRVDNGLTQMGLRLASGINQTKISHIECGYLSPSDEEKQKIAAVLGVQVDDILWPEAAA